MSQRDDNARAALLFLTKLRERVRGCDYRISCVGGVMRIQVRRRRKSWIPKWIQAWWIGRGIKNRKVIVV